MNSSGTVGAKAQSPCTKASEPTSIRTHSKVFLPYIEKCYGDPSKELVKYIYKDIDSDGSKIPPRVMAKLYECRDRKRFAQGSKRFIQLGESDPSCPECHVSYALMRPDRRFVAGPTETPNAAGPSS